MRFIVLTALGAVLALAPSWAQAESDDAVIDTILSQKTISFGYAAWLAGRSNGAYDESVSPANATTLASVAGWGTRGEGLDTPLDLQSYCYLLVKAFRIPTGLVYSWFPGPRYALRELVYRKIVPANLAPDGRVSGEEAMRYLQATQDWKAAKE